MTHLKQPVAPSVKGGEDGGVDVAAVDALKSHKFRSISLKEGEKGVANKMHGATFIMVIAPTIAVGWPDATREDSHMMSVEGRRGGTQKADHVRR